jgi:transcription antitermination protein NusB
MYTGGTTLSAKPNRPEDDSLQTAMSGSRRKGRELALQGLYAMELSGNSVDKVMQDLVGLHRADETAREFARSHIEKTYANQSKLDDYIRQFAANWEFERIAILDRIILRLAICEFLHFWDIPPKVSIDEAIELSKSYSTEQSSRFVNGILDSVLLDLKENHQLIKVGRGLQDGSEPHEDTAAS